MLNPQALAPRAHLHSEIAGLAPNSTPSPDLATRGADDAGGLNAVVTVGAGALHLLWRGYADPAPRGPRGPRLNVATGFLAETLSSPLVATCTGPA